MAAALAGAIIAALSAAAPAFAAGAVDVHLNSVASNMTAGGRADNFSASFKNTTDQVFNVKVVFAVRLRGISPDQVRIIRTPFTELPGQDVNGVVIFTDQDTLGFLPRTSQNRNYSIQFAGEAPAGHGNLLIEVFRGDTVAGTDDKNITVKGGGGPTPSDEPSVTPTEPTVTDPPLTTGGAVAPAPTFTLPPNEDALATADRGGVPVGLYIMGALLVGVGGAILWLLLRQRPPSADAAFPTAAYDMVPPSLRYPSRHAEPGGPHLNPTAPLPGLRGNTLAGPLVANPGGQEPSAYDRQAPPPPADPWAGQADDPTRSTIDPPTRFS